MTNVFGIQNCKGKETSANDFDGAEFISKQIEADELESFENIEEAKEIHDKKIRLPLPLSILKGICFFVGMITVASILRADVTLKEAYSNAPYIFYMLMAAWMIFGVLQVIEIIKRKKHLASDEFKEFIEDTEEVAAKSMCELGIPTNAPLIDVFTYVYKIKKNKDYPVSSEYKFITSEYFLYQDYDNLYLSDHTMVLAFKKNEFMHIEKINSRTTGSYWNKEGPCTSQKYKKYKITQNQYGTVFYKYHYSLQLSHNGKVYEILIPPYEIAMIAKILNLPYEE